MNSKTIDHLPPIKSLPLRKRLSVKKQTLCDASPNITSIPKPIKQPLKKAYNCISLQSMSHRKQPLNSCGLSGNPLLWNNGDTEKYAPWASAEDTIDSFKSAWLGDQDEEDGEEEREQEEKKFVVKKSNSISAGSTKRGRPSISKRSLSMDDQAPIKVRKNSGKYTTEGKLYCVCRQSYDATRFMIACDRCDDWFHGECININEKESEFIDLYFCTKCSKITGKKTLWKPKCVNPACHKAARISSSLGHLSKYCSDSCGMQVARARLELVEMKRRQTGEHSVSIAKLTLMKQRQLRIESFADKQDRKRLIEIRKEKQKIRDCVNDINRQSQLLKKIILESSSNNNDDDCCQFDSRVVSPEQKSVLCNTQNCLKHIDWQTLIQQEYDQERKEQFNLLIHLQEETDQVKSRMRERRSEKSTIKDLVNGTIPFLLYPAI